MAREDKNYEDLLSRFDSEAPVKKKTEKKENAGAVKPSAPPMKTAQPRTTRRINPDMEDISSDSSNDLNGKKRGVYFSNPPKAIKDQAAREQGIAINGETKRKVNKRSQSLKESAQKKEQKRTEKIKVAGIMLAIIVGVSAILCIYGIGCINDVLALNVEDKSVEVRVEKGMTDSDVIDILHDNDLIKNKMFCKLFIKFFNKDGEYISGIYTLTPSLGVEKMISTMKTDYKNAETITLTFPEGWTISQIAEKLEVNEVCTASSFISTLQTVDFSEEYDFIASIPDQDKRFRLLEGYLYPDTYEFYIGENASSVVRRFLNNFENRWTEEYQAQAEKRGLSLDEVIVMASVIQKEAANESQMGKVSSILYNRLDRPSSFPYLECDSTYDYVENTIKPALTSSVEDTQRLMEYRANYRTYRDPGKEGLPIGPISNPGGDAIEAALYPEDTSYLYFRHDAKGGIYYANTLAEHEENGRIAAKVGD